MENDAIVKIVFYATERANVKMDDIRSNTLMPRENSSLFIVGNWKKRTRHRKENEMTFH